MTFRHWELARRRPLPRQRTGCTGLAAAVRVRLRLAELEAPAAADHAGESTTLTMHTADLLKVLEAAAMVPELVKLCHGAAAALEHHGAGEGDFGRLPERLRAAAVSPAL